MEQAVGKTILWPLPFITGNIMLNLAGMLMAPPVEAMKPAEAREKYQEHKVRRKYHDSNQRYRLYLENQTKTIKELAVCMNMTYEGAYATVSRMVKRGQIKVVSYLPSTGGRKTMLLTWSKEDSQ